MWAAKAHTFTYDEVLADSKLRHIIYSIEPDYRHSLASHLYRHSHTIQKYWWLIQIITPITRLPLELFQQILLIIVDNASHSPLTLMLVCKYWYATVTGIWASLKLGTTTSVDAVTSNSKRNQSILDISVDTEFDRSHFIPSEGAYQAIFAAMEATSRWRSFIVETFPPQADLPEHLVNSRLQRCSGAVMSRLRTFKIKCACEMSPLLDRLLRILGASASGELTIVEINSPSVISLLAPSYPSVFHSVKVFSLDTPGLPNPVDILPHLHQLESLTASHLSFPTYHNDANLPCVRTLRHLSLRAVSIQWMSGRTFHVLEMCTILFPLHRHVLRTFSTKLPNCKQLTFQGYPLNILDGISAHILAHLSVTCSSSYKPRGNQELVRFSSRALRESQLATRVLHISIEATNEAWINSLALMSHLEELVIDNTEPSSLGAKVLRLFAVHPNNLRTPATPGSRNTPVCPSLKRFGLRYRRWLRPSEHFDLIPQLISMILSRKRSNFSLNSLQVWMWSDKKDPLELIDGSWISLEGFKHLVNNSAINVIPGMASILVEEIAKPFGKPPTACPQPPLASLPLLPPPSACPPPPLPDLHLPDLVSLTVRVTRPYKDARYEEINLIKGEYIYDVEPSSEWWWTGTTVDGKRGLFPASYVKQIATPNETEGPPLPLPVRPAPKNRTLTVLVTCSHKAEWDNEINLVKGEYIYDVEQLDGEWWRGITVGGDRGLFPSSYVVKVELPNEVGVSTRPYVKTASSPVTSGTQQRSRQRQKRSRRKRKGDNDGSKFSKPLQPALNARGPLAPQDKPGLLFPEHEDDGWLGGWLLMKLAFTGIRIVLTLCVLSLRLRLNIVHKYTSQAMHLSQTS